MLSPFDIGAGIQAQGVANFGNQMQNAMGQMYGIQRDNADRQAMFGGNLSGGAQMPQQGFPQPSPMDSRQFRPISNFNDFGRREGDLDFNSNLNRLGKRRDADLAYTREKISALSPLFSSLFGGGFGANGGGGLNFTTNFGASGGFGAPSSFQSAT